MNKRAYKTTIFFLLAVGVALLLGVLLVDNPQDIFNGDMVNSAGFVE